VAGLVPHRRRLEAPPEALRALALVDPVRFPVLLDSAADGPLAARSVLAVQPTGALWCDASGRLGTDGLPADLSCTLERQPGFLAALEYWWRAERRAGSATSALDGFSGGWFVFLGYEIAAEIEPRLRLPRETTPWRAWALRVPVAIEADLRSGEVTGLAEPGHEAALGTLASDLRAAPPQRRAGSAALAVTEEPPALFLSRVERAKAYIAAGDIYQANLCRAWTARASAPIDVAPLYARLCAENPAPFAALARFRGLSVLSSSPERLLRVLGREASTRPIAGTRPRSRRPGEDAPEATALVQHPKERAEHVMLIDLERNDLGRVCVAGSVVVDEFMAVETYAHVHHIVSNVRGTLREDVSPVAALRAVFPGGTITGCPKVRCMELIAELEGAGRGAYTGSLGYLNRDGSLDFNILIRTLAVTGNALEARAGAGIVADSDPQRELDETRAKARGLLAALGAAA
jgi:anthranilate synthase component 1